MKPRRENAIYELVGGGITIDGSYSNVIYNDGQTPPTEEEIDTKLAEMQAEYDVQAYARNRKREYDTLNQLELMTDDAENSTSSHATAIGVIKTKWPKDNSGPVE